MEQIQQVGLLKELMRQLDERVNADAGVILRNPTSAYTCPELAAREWQQFFQGHPQLIGLTGDLPEPGSFMTVEDFGVPILATRDSDGSFHAFVNACRHRGVRVVNEGRGKAIRFRCPFHNWTYSNKGKLIGIPQEDHFGAVDKSSRGLIELPAFEHSGLLWVHPKPEGNLQIDDLLGALAPEIAHWDFGRMVFVGESVIDMKLNWKLANDTFGETYHFQKLHKNTLGQLFHGDVLAYEKFGRNHRFVFANKAIDDLRELPEEDWQLTHGAGLLYYLFPNIQFNLGRGTVNLIRIYSDGANPGRSITERNQFAWILRYPGPRTWDEMERAYYASPARLAFDPDAARLIARAEQYFVKSV